MLPRVFKVKKFKFKMKKKVVKLAAKAVAGISVLTLKWLSGQARGFLL